MQAGIDDGQANSWSVTHLFELAASEGQRNGRMKWKSDIKQNINRPAGRKN